MALTVDSVRRRFPKSPSDWMAFLILVFGIHSVVIFELFVVLPFLYMNREFSGFYYFHIFAAVFIYFNTMGNLVMVMITETGTQGLMLPVMLKEGWRFCYVCECNAPPRSYHCHICKKCLLKRDHHCTFAGCCIGHKNQRYFYLMVVFIWIASLYASIMNVEFIYHLFGEMSLKTAFILIVPLFAWALQLVETVSIGMAFMASLCIIAFLISSALLGYHTVNILNGQTVYEKTHKIKDYDLGFLGNIESVFGKNWKICWISPFIFSPPVGDGLEFKRKEDYERVKEK